MKERQTAQISMAKRNKCMAIHIAREARQILGGIYQENTHHAYMMNLEP
jgi:hypothetical protein